MPEYLQCLYENILYQVVQAIPPRELAKAIPRLSPLPYFFTCMCNHKIAPDQIDNTALKIFIRERHLKGNTVKTITTYLHIFRRCTDNDICTPFPDMDGQTMSNFVRAYVNELEKQRLHRGSKPNPGHTHEVRFVTPTDELIKIKQKCHPRG